jgi:uncharacterized protein (DUF58 family)
MKPLADLLHRLGSAWRIDAAPDVHAPLLSDAELDDIVRRMQALRPAGRHAWDVHQRHSGDLRSAHLGRGLDFEESRAYQRGDDIRDMDWRTTARTGKPHLKIYREEHQPTLHLVVDRGASMRFGTRTQLKAALAARIAAMFAFGAAAGNASVGGTLWQPGGFMLPGSSGQDGAIRLIHAAIAPCPPLPETSACPAFSEVLRQLDFALPNGSRVILISDFRTLCEGDLPWLARLASHHEVRAIQVLDPAETELPQVGLMRFRDMVSGNTAWLDTGSRALRRAFQEQAALSHEKQHALFGRVGIPLERCLTSEDPFDLWARMERGLPARSGQDGRDPAVANG